MPIRNIRSSVAIGLNLHLKIIRADHADDLLDDRLRRSVHADVGMDLELEIRQRKLFEFAQNRLRDNVLRVVSNDQLQAV